MRKELTQLREAMARHGVDWYLVPTDDFHGSEYVGDFFKCRSHVSGFTGSAGTLLVSGTWAGLWTDGRYFLQAAQQLEGSGIDLMKMGEPDVPSLTAFLSEQLQAGQVLGFDGRTVSGVLYDRLKRIAEEHGASVACGMDLAGESWTDRPPMSAEPVFELPAELVGQSRAEKLAHVRAEIAKAGADTLVLASLADICWLYNIRGNDVACTPVVLSFSAVTEREAILFLNPAVLPEDVRAHLEADGVEIRPYGGIDGYVRGLKPGSTVMLNPAVVNSAILAAVPEGVRVLPKTDPTVLPKAAKNPTEVANIREAHVKDGVAVTRLMYWLKHEIGRTPMDELSVAEKLEEFRREQEHYLEPSFSPIIAYGPHGAIVHYSATEESNAVIQPRSFLLADTGGHYLEGTTDITRTFAMGPLTDEEKRFYTLVLKGHLRLGAARFQHGCTGLNLDYLAREPLWRIGMDYNHGTGHGVGYVLGVHEGPQGFRWRQNGNAAVLEPGMVTSDEPGIYLEGKFGIRLENLTVVCETLTNEYGRFLHLEYLTMVPFDLEAIVPEMLEPCEKAWLNEYHELVREKLLPRLPEEEGRWLLEVTRPIA